VADQGKAHNVGQALFESLGAGLQALPGFFAQEQQRQMQNLQLQMQQERFQFQKEESQARLAQANFNLQQAQEESFLTPEQKGQRQAEQQLGEISGLGMGLIGEGLSDIMGAVDASLPQLRDLTLEQSGVDIFSGLEGKAGGFPTENELILSLFGEAGLKEKLDPFGLSTEETRTERGQKERALVNSVFDRMREINPDAFGEIEDLEAASDEQFLLSKALSDFAEKRDRPGLFTGDDIIPDQELLKRIDALRSFKEGRIDVEFPTDEEIAAQPTPEPTPRQEAFQSAQVIFPNFASTSAENQETVVQDITNFIVARGRPPQNLEELEDFYR